MIDYQEKGVVWYAMKTTYKKELKAKKYLDSQGVECFVPMQTTTTIKGGRRCLMQKPAIHNLIFVKTDLAQLNEIKISLNYLHNRLTACEGNLSPMIVPTEQMEQFIDAVTNHLDAITFVDLEQEFIEKDTPVRIIDGKFKGYTGELINSKRRLEKQVFINIQGLVAYKLKVDINHIEKI